jgi:hypothetical protein
MWTRRAERQQHAADRILRLSAYPPRAGVADLGAKVHLLEAGSVLTEEHGRGVLRWLDLLTRVRQRHAYNSLTPMEQRMLHAAALPASLRLCCTAGHRSVAQKLRRLDNATLDQAVVMPVTPGHPTSVDGGDQSAGMRTVMILGTRPQPVAGFVARPISPALAKINMAMSGRGLVVWQTLLTC